MLGQLAIVSLLLTAGCGAAARPCASIPDACGCHERADCQLVTEACWCPSECDPKVACVCGGGKFLRCDTRK